MPIVLKEKMGQQVPEGTHLAVCHRICHVGTQPDGGFGEKEKLVISWELPHERMERDGKEFPMGCSKFYSLGTTGGMNKKSGLRKDLAAWRGKDFSKEELTGFELKNILGKGCQVVVEHNEEGRSRVTGVFGLPKGTQVPPPTNPQVEYSIADGKNEVFNALPDFLKSMCLACLEWNGGVERPVKSSEPEFPPDDPNGDSVPF